MSNLTLGSLFDGSGGFPLGGLLCGITPLWASEIEPFPIRVTTKQIPQMKHYGDISTINGAEIEPVDIITFGSPCTDMSVAGKRAGLDGQQSVLFYEAIRIIKEMRCATNGKCPRFIVWENVPGAFSSNKGADFHAVLKAIAEIKDQTSTIPMSDKNKWLSAGEILGNDYSIAWRTLDAQYWGVPQRRKRIYLVADFTGGCAGKILFESEGLSGYSKESLCSWQGTAKSAEVGTGEASTICLNDQGGQRMDVLDNMTSTLRAKANHPPCVMFENHSQDTRYKEVDIAPTVSATYGTGGNNQPFVTSAGFCTEHSAHSRGIGYEEEVSPTLRAGVVPATVSFEDTPKTLKIRSGVESYSLQGSMIGRKDENGPNGDGINENVSFTLNTTDRHAVVYAIDRESYNCGQNYARKMGISDDGINSTLNAQGPSAVGVPSYSMTTGSFMQINEEKAPTLAARDYKDPPCINDVAYTVRRLTPKECCRLQGFPDCWCADLGTENPTKEDITLWSEVFETH